MSNKKEMTKIEIGEALECFVRCERYESAKAMADCENCPYIDFCWDLERLIKQKPKKYL